LLGVNGRIYSPTVLHDAIREAKNDSKPIELLVQAGSFQKTYSVNYRGGEKYPELERVSSVPDMLSEIIKPLAAQPK
jgi:hypothetical protein